MRLAILCIRLVKGYGVDVVVDKQARGLSRLGYHVDVYTTTIDYQYYPSSEYKVHLTRGGNLLIKILKKRRYDCVIAHTTPFFEILPKLTPHTTTIAYEHGDPTPSLFSAEEVSYRQKIKDYKRLFVYPLIDNVCTISKFIAQDIGWSSADINYNGSDHLYEEAASYISPPEDFFSHLRNRPDDRIILSVSRFGYGEFKYKGLDTLIGFWDRLRRCEGYRLVVLGRGNQKEKKEIESKGIHVILNASRSELIRAYQACDAFVSFSKWEGFNLPLTEAQSFGKPAFALDNTCHREVTPKVYSTVEQLLDALVSSTEADLKDRGQQCREFVKPLTWRRNITALDDIIRKTSSTAVKGANTSDAKTKITERVNFYRFRLNNLIHMVHKGFRKAKNMLNRVTTDSLMRPWERHTIISSPLPDIPGSLAPVRRPPIKLNTAYEKDLVSICILTKNKLEYLKPCINSILKHTNMKKAEILIGDTGSTEEDILGYYENLPAYVFLETFSYYNFSEHNNELSKNAKGEFVLFLNNDTVATHGWLDNLLLPMIFDQVAVTGAKLLYNNGTIQHAGVEIFTRKPHQYVGWHPYARLPADYGPTNRMMVMPAVTGACMLIRHKVFDDVGGFDVNYQEECQDTDLCLQICRENFKVIYTPYACLYHFENSTRTVRESSHDRSLFKKKWRNYIDSVLLSAESQSVPWKPTVCLYESGDIQKNEKDIGRVIELSKLIPHLSCTIKTRDVEKGKCLSKLLGSVPNRVVSIHDEDKHGYDHIIYQ